MKVHEDLLEKWKVLRSPGDAQKLQEEYNKQHGVVLSDENFNRVFRVGKCSDAVFEIMAEFYQKKAELVKTYL